MLALANLLLLLRSLIHLWLGFSWDIRQRRVPAVGT